MNKTILLGLALVASVSAANAYHATGSIQGIHEFSCQLFRKRMECAIMLQVALSENAID